MNLQPRKMKTIVSTNISPANMKNSEDCSVNILDSATTITMIWPKAMVRSQAACTTDFMEAGAWL